MELSFFLAAAPWAALASLSHPFCPANTYRSSAIVVPCDGSSPPVTGEVQFWLQAMATGTEYWHATAPILNSQVTSNGTGNASATPVREAALSGALLPAGIKGFSLKAHGVHDFELYLIDATTGKKIIGLDHDVKSKNLTLTKHYKGMNLTYVRQAKSNATSGKYFELIEMEGINKMKVVVEATSMSGKGFYATMSYKFPAFQPCPAMTFGCSVYNDTQAQSYTMEFMSWVRSKYKTKSLAWASLALPFVRSQEDAVTEGTGRRVTNVDAVHWKRWNYIWFQWPGAMDSGATWPLSFASLDQNDDSSIDEKEFGQGFDLLTPTPATPSNSWHLQAIVVASVLGVILLALCMMCWMIHRKADLKEKNGGTYATLPTEDHEEEDEEAPPKHYATEKLLSSKPVPAFRPPEPQGQFPTRAQLVLPQPSWPPGQQGRQVWTVMPPPQTPMWASVQHPQPLSGVFIDPQPMMVHSINQPMYGGRARSSSPVYYREARPQFRELSPMHGQYGTMPSSNGSFGQEYPGQSTLSPNYGAGQFEMHDYFQGRPLLPTEHLEWPAHM